jgi:hypothetical protein
MAIVQFSWTANYIWKPLPPCLSFLQLSHSNQIIFIIGNAILLTREDGKMRLSHNVATPLFFPLRAGIVKGQLEVLDGLGLTLG